MGARVDATDLDEAIDAARDNLPGDAMTVQADLRAPRFAPDSFDLVMAIGLLHHLPDFKAGFRAMVPIAKSGRWIHIYAYWLREAKWQRRLLGAVRMLKRITTRLPHPALHALRFQAAAVLWAPFVLPNRLANGIPSLREIVDRLPLKTYAEYPFAVLVNDTSDRFSASIEHRDPEENVRRWFSSARLPDVTVILNTGWVASAVSRTAITVVPCAG